MADTSQYPASVVERAAISEIDDDHSMIGKGPPSIHEKFVRRQLGRHPSANEGIDDHQVGVPVAQLGDAAAAVGAAHLDAAANG